jgi:hypothetical protein
MQPTKLAPAVDWMKVPVRLMAGNVRRQTAVTRHGVLGAGLKFRTPNPATLAARWLASQKPVVQQYANAGKCSTRDMQQ